MLQITLEETSRFFKKDDETVHIFLAANQPIDCKIVLKANTLANILLGAIDVQKAIADRPVSVITGLSKEKTRELLSTLFPRKQFLAFDFW
ncbi:MAG: hypothetical protein ACQXXH_07925 [Candidatus Bathyarchaeia archaeon]|nr:hypothetical protein [Candidatus Bathyarchaeota archaeon A05DMB-4]MDH7595149.1 hypothetical protein [Candidatus Bathyarchaeota archaeon]